jgi:hypothetical protein
MVTQRDKDGSEFLDDLMAQDALWEGTEAPERKGRQDGEFEPIPEGDYVVRIERAYVTKSQAGKLMVKWGLVITGPACAKRWLWKNHMVGGEGLKYLKGDLEAIGVTLGKVSDLPRVLPTLIGRQIEVAVKARADSDEPNVYFNRALSGAQGKPASKPRPVGDGEVPPPRDDDF